MLFTKKVRNENPHGEYFTKTSIFHHNFALQSCCLQICVWCCCCYHTFSLIAVAVMMLNVLFCRLNVLLQGLAYKLGVCSCTGFANLLKSRMRCARVLEICISGTCSYTALVDEGLFLQDYQSWTHIASFFLTTAHLSPSVQPLFHVKQIWK